MTTPAPNPTDPPPTTVPAATPPAPLPTPPAAPVPPAPATGEDGKDWKAEAEKWQGLAHKHERRQLEALGFDADQVEAIRAARKDDPNVVATKTTGYDDLAARLQTLETERDHAVVAATRAEVAAAKGVPITLLGGSTRADMEASADALLTFRGAVPPAPPATGQGTTGTPIQGATDRVKELDTRIAEAAKARNFTLAIQLKQERAAIAAAKN